MQTDSKKGPSGNTTRRTLESDRGGLPQAPQREKVQEQTGTGTLYQNKDTLLLKMFLQ